MDSLSIQYNLLYGALLRVFGDQVELVYINASRTPGRQELGALFPEGIPDLPVVSCGDQVLFSGRIPVTALIRHVRRIVAS